MPFNNVTDREFQSRKSSRLSSSKNGDTKQKDTWVVWCTGGGVLRVWVPRHQTAFIIDPTTHSVIKRSSRKKRKVPDRLSLCAGTKNWGINNLTWDQNLES